MFETKSYWAGTSDYHEQYTLLVASLIPDRGKCDTIEGELLRAAGRLTYDYYNNGFGNDWSHSYAYLRDFKKNNPEIAGGMNTGNALSVLRPYKNGRMLCTNMATALDTKLQEALLRIMDECVKAVIAQDGKYHTNATDSIEYARLPDDDAKTRNAQKLARGRQRRRAW
jgi:hypothetical protein